MSHWQNVSRQPFKNNCSWSLSLLYRVTGALPKHGVKQYTIHMESWYFISIAYETFYLVNLFCVLFVVVVKCYSALYLVVGLLSILRTCNWGFDCLTLLRKHTSIRRKKTGLLSLYLCTRSTMHSYITRTLRAINFALSWQVRLHTEDHRTAAGWATFPANKNRTQNKQEAK